MSSTLTEVHGPGGRRSRSGVTSDTIPTPSVVVEDHIVKIRSLDVRDDVAVTYIGQLHESERVAAVRRCVRVGAIALTSAGDQTGAALLAEAMKASTESHRALLGEVSKTADESVRRAAEALLKGATDTVGKIGKDLERVLDPQTAGSVTSKLQKALLDGYTEVTARAKADLDMANPRSPLSLLRAEIEKNEERRHAEVTKQISELLQQNAGKAAAAAERAKSTRKGVDFEAATGEFLEAESRTRKDLVRHCGNEVGLTGSKLGDYTVEINPSEGHGSRIVLELTTGSRTMSVLERDLSKAMENRGAAFGISVVTDSTIASQTINPVGDDKLIVKIPTLPDGVWDYTALAVALEGARWKTVMGRMTAGSLDAKRVLADIEAAFTLVNRAVTEAKRKITTSKNQLDSIAEYVDEMFRRELGVILQRIRDTLSAGNMPSD